MSPPKTRSSTAANNKVMNEAVVGYALSKNKDLLMKLLVRRYQHFCKNIEDKCIDYFKEII